MVVRCSSHARVQDPAGVTLHCAMSFATPIPSSKPSESFNSATDDLVVWRALPEAVARCERMYLSALFISKGAKSADFSHIEFVAPRSRSSQSSPQRSRKTKMVGRTSINYVGNVQMEVPPSMGTAMAVITPATARRARRWSVSEAFQGSFRLTIIPDHCGA